jgi:broad specificity phosphatase PhoE
MATRIVLIRHGQTAWSLSGQHTGRTDIPLTDAGQSAAIALKPVLAKFTFSHVLASPLSRARDTAKLAGFDSPTIEPDLMEWNYGQYDGRTTKEIRKQQPDWDVFTHGAPGGESPADVTRRIDALLARFEKLQGTIAVFSHGHFLRCLAARYIGQPITLGRSLSLDTGSLSILGTYREDKIIERWNAPAQG